MANFKLFSNHLVCMANWPLKTCPNLHHLQGALKFATKISPLLNYEMLLFSTKSERRFLTNFTKCKTFFYVMASGGLYSLFNISEILCSKLKLYGFQESTVAWFRSFMIGRAQRIKIGNAISSKLDLESGIPQGRILSPIFQTILFKWQLNQ